MFRFLSALGLQVVGAATAMGAKSATDRQSLPEVNQTGVNDARHKTMDKYQHAEEHEKARRFFS
jgi:hypothetical protein